MQHESPLSMSNDNRFTPPRPRGPTHRRSPIGTLITEHRAGGPASIMCMNGTVEPLTPDQALEALIMWRGEGASYG